MKKQEKKDLHGNLARAGKDENNILPQSYREASQPERYGFEDLPGSPEDLKKARSRFQQGGKQ